ncbi:EAL domain-containing protein [Acidovorax facilis]|uniref:EAL domain-containing protein n=1 Tax=Acidovorax facilis TaxID=12917 RepID=UPI003CEC783A
MIEDDLNDAAPVVNALQRASLDFTSRRVDTEVRLRQELSAGLPDAILSDFSMQNFSGLGALAVAREVCPDVPFIFVSGTIGEENAISALRSGAADYILKHDLGRLAPAIHRALNDASLKKEQKRTQEALQHSEMRFRLAASTGDVWDWYIDTGVAQISAQWKSRLGYEDQEIENTASAWLDLLEPNDRQMVLDAFAAHIKTRSPYDVEYRALAKDGSYRWSHAKGQAVWAEDGRATYMAGSVVDITEQKNAELKVKRLNRIYAVLSSINSLIVRTQDRKELFQEACEIAVNAGEFRLAWIGITDSELNKLSAVAWAGAGEDYIEHIPMGLDPGNDADFGLIGKCIENSEAILVQDIKNDGEIVLKYQAITRGFRSFGLFPLCIKNRPIGIMALYASEQNFFDHDEIQLLRELASDIAFSLDHLEKSERLNYLAYYDALTGLPNRSLLQDRLHQLIKNAVREEEKSCIALIWINIQRFKNINETLGRHTGDALLQVVAKRLVEALGSNDKLARMGADHFGIIATYRVIPAEVAHLLSEKIFPLLDRPIAFEGKELYLSFRTGISLFPDDGADADTLFAHAEAASRESGVSGGRYQFYTTSMNSRVHSQLSMESKLHKALKNEEFLLHYQPKVSLWDGKMTGMEALIRWNDPDAGLVSPTVFIPILEETGLIIEVGQWVLHKSIEDYENWRSQGLSPPRIAVNVSAVQMRQSEFAKILKSCLKGYQGSEVPLDIEITESLFMEDVDANIQRLHDIRAMGVRLAIDDFGTGYSSLAYLKRFPVNYLKIDQSFVREVIFDPDAAAICNAIIDLAHNLKLKVIAEGVETEAQMHYLHRKTCDEIQGYLFSKPLDAFSLGRLLADGYTLKTAEQPSGITKKILIVDDEPSILASMRRLLRRDGYEILAANSAKEGFLILAQQEVQVIISDQRMPEMSGTEFLSRARELYPETIRIVLSGYTDLESISDAINRGSIYKFLTKPWDDELLRENVREAFRHYDAAQRKRPGL